MTCALVLGGALVASPAFGHKLSTRTSDQESVWDRQNQISAGLRMVAAKPLFGFGWSRYTADDLEYFRESPEYPMNGYTTPAYEAAGRALPLHETYLAYTVELGLVGALLWLVSLLGGIGLAITQRGPRSLRPWKLGLLTIAICFLVIGLFNPYQAPFPVLLLWVWAGVALGAPAMSAVRKAPAPLPLTP
jgi:O-antigen ligase